MTSRKPVNKLLACIMAVMIVLAYMPVTAQFAFAKENPFEGDGTSDNPYKIENAEDLITLANVVNSGDLETKGKYFIVTEDIELNPVEEQGDEQSEGPQKKKEGQGDGQVEGQDVIWEGIGTEEHPFEGYFNFLKIDNNIKAEPHAIIGLKGEQGLFGHVKGATIGNIVVFGEVIAEGADEVAGLVGCICEGDEDEGTLISKSGSYIDVTATKGETAEEGTGSDVGGLVGHVEDGTTAWVVDSFNKGDITGYENVGGIIGNNESYGGETEKVLVMTSYNLGCVTATHSDLRRNHDALAGGICATECGVENCYSTGTITGYHRGNSNRTSERGYAIKSGDGDEPDNYFWLEGSAQRSYGNNTKDYSTEEEFTDGTVLSGLNEREIETYKPWIDGYKVRVPYEELQKYPGLDWEKKSLEELKKSAIIVLMEYVDEDNYGEVQQEVLVKAVTDGAKNIQEAEDEQAIDAALADAEMAINNIPTLAEIHAARVIIQSYPYEGGKTYNEDQQKEIDEILETAFELFDTAESNQQLETMITAVKQAIDQVPSSEEVEKADAEKAVLAEVIAYANNTMSMGEYTADSLDNLKKAIADAKDVYKDGDAFEADVKAAEKAVWEALMELERGNDTAKCDLLKTLIEANAVDGSLYKKSTYTALRNAISDANKVLADKDASVESLKAARTAVLEAQNSLMKKSPNTLTVSAKTKSVKYKKVKKKKQVVKAITVKNAKGKVSYAKSSGSKYLTVSKSSGKITVKKGTKKGKHTIKVKVTAAGDDNYKSGSKTVSVTVKVK